MDLSQIKSKIETSLDQGQKGLCVFDCDGTIWSEDAGDIFLSYVIENSLIKDLSKDLLDKYKDLYQKEPALALQKMSDLYQGLSVTEIQSWAKECSKVKKLNGFSVMKELIEFLKEKSLPIYFVTASLKWSVEPYALSLYGIKPEFVIGVQNEVSEKGIVTGKAKPLSFREGKLTRLKEANSQDIFLGAGNSLDDKNFLEKAHIPLAVAWEKKIKDNEIALRELAKKNSWFYGDVS